MCERALVIVINGQRGEIAAAHASAANIWLFLLWPCAAGLISRQTNQDDGGKPFRRIGSGIAERRQFTRSHQNWNVMLREAKRFRRCHDIQAGRKSEVTSLS